MRVLGMEMGDEAQCAGSGGSRRDCWDRVLRHRGCDVRRINPLIRFHPHYERVSGG